MTPLALSAVIPAYNASADIGETIDALAVALENSPAFQPEIVLVDDGSTDGTADAAVAACAGRVPLQVISQANSGRFEARRAGLAAATGDWVLLLDSRVTLDPQALAFVAGRLGEDASVWNGHVHVADGGNPLGIFWRLLAELAWADYFDDPRETSFGIADFDRYPKGTTCFLARRDDLRDAIAAFGSRYADVRSANDDTPVIRWLAERGPIHLSPQFSCTYKPRTTLRTFLRHAVHRGVVFLDGHADTKSRFFPAIVAFYPVSAGLALAAARRPIAVPAATALVVGAGAAGYAATRGRTGREIGSLLLAAPLYATGHGLGMWKGLAMMVRDRAARG